MKKIGETSVRKKVEAWRLKSAVLVFYDIIFAALSFFLALWLRYGCNARAIPHDIFRAYYISAGIYVLFIVIMNWLFRLYNSIWKFAGMPEFIRIICATAVDLVFNILLVTAAFGLMPAMYYVCGILFQFIFVCSARFSRRLLEYCRGYLRRRGVKGRLSGVYPSNIMLIGAGDAGQLILHDINKSGEINGKVRCIIDDDPEKWGRVIEGVPVIGGRDKIVSAAGRYHINRIFLVIPSVTFEEKRKILDICKTLSCEIKELPNIYKLYTGEITVSKMKDVPVEDLLGRKPVTVDLKQIFEYLSDKVVLVTGAGGSIGSELCNQIAAHNVKLLVMFDCYENNLYDVQFSLKNRFPGLKFVSIIGSVRDSRKLKEVFSHYRPEVVFHAAAHKHVPLMEDSPCEAIKNNALGTYKTAYAAALYGCRRFVLISTDKAVNPTNIMGASKRLCEMIVQSFDKKIKEKKAAEIPALFTHAFDEEDAEQAIIPDTAVTEFVAVRFGNVLGSNGSVIPLFKKQIEMGGPVTVTHPDIVRYFMTIPEAVSLVLQAAAFAHGGEIFVLDMGEPVKIDALARNLISLSGYRPDEDIKIVYTGLRPGEKLYEEKLMAEEGLKRTSNELIHIGMPIPFEEDVFLKQLSRLMQAAYDNRPDIRELVAEVVTTYRFKDGDANVYSSGEPDEPAVSNDGVKEIVSGLKSQKEIAEETSA